MGLFNNIFSKRSKVDNRFIEFVKALDKGENWAKEEYQRLWEQENNDGSLFPSTL